MTSETTSSSVRVPALPGAQRGASRGILLGLYLLAVIAMLPTQLFRLHQDAALPWLLADYAGRLFVLGLLFILPAGRAVLLRAEKRRASRLEAILWIIGLVLVFSWSGLFEWLWQLFPDGRLGDYPRPTGWLYLFDLTCGIALVALHEEMVGRRLAAVALQRFFRSEWLLILVSALIFAAYHWWTGIGNMIGCLIYGLAAMACYRRTGSLWPVGIAHYLIDVIAFA